VTAGYGIPVGHPATAVTARPSQPHNGRAAPTAGTPGRTYVGFTSPGNLSLSLSLSLPVISTPFFTVYSSPVHTADADATQHDS